MTSIPTNSSAGTAQESTAVLQPIYTAANCCTRANLLLRTKVSVMSTAFTASEYTGRISLPTTFLRQYAAACEGRAALEEAENALAGGFGLDAVSVCVDDALSALCRLTGEDASEAVVEEVFSTFCVGK